MRQLQNQVQALKVERDLTAPRASRRCVSRMLPVEQAPQIVEAASTVLHGTNLSIYGDGAEVLGQIGPLLGLVARAVHQATPGVGESSPVSEDAQPVAARSRPGSLAGAVYSASVTWPPHSLSGPLAGASQMARWVMKWSGAAPCQCHSPGAV